MILIRNQFTMCGCHLSGEENYLADLLSHTSHLRVQDTLKALHSKTNTHKLLSLNNISIQELPQHLKSWISTTLDVVMHEKVPSAPPTRQKSQLGQDGQNSQRFSKSKTSISHPTNLQNHTESSSHSSHVPEGLDLEKELLMLLKHLISERSSQLLARPSFYEA